MGAIPALASDEGWLAQMRIGVGVEILIDGQHVPARLAWVSTQRTLFLFVPVLEKEVKPLVYSSISILKAMRDGILRPFEYAPLFERAVESLMIGVESLSLQKT